MDTHKLRVRIGAHEFEAEGTKESVSEQFNIWKELIAAMPDSTAAQAATSRTPPATRHASGPALENDALARLFVTNDKTKNISLAFHPVGEKRNADSLLLLLYAYRRLQALEEVPVTKLLGSLKESGIVVGRADRVLDPFVRENVVLKSGRAKGSKYRLSNTGIGKAEQIVRELLEQMG